MKMSNLTAYVLSKTKTFKCFALQRENQTQLDSYENCRGNYQVCAELYSKQIRTDLEFVDKIRSLLEL